MSTLQLAVVLIGILTVLNAIAVVALIRQVGVLHLRIAPVPGVPGGGGPDYGSELALPASPQEIAQQDAELFVVGFVSPTCNLCASLTTAFGQLAKSLAVNMAPILVIDADEQAAATYLRSKGVSAVPYLADTASFKANVPGAPWAVVTNRTGEVMVSAGVNTLDNLEEMVAQAEYVVAHPPPLASSVAVEASESATNYEDEEARSHVL